MIAQDIHSLTRQLSPTAVSRSNVTDWPLNGVRPVSQNILTTEALQPSVYSRGDTPVAGQRFARFEQSISLPPVIL